MRRLVVMGNWKLNGSKEMVSNLIKDLDVELAKVEGADKVGVAIAPPVMYLDLAEKLIADAKSDIILGAQNVDLHHSGAFTGDISVDMLKDFNASYIIIGHSERREYHKESDEFVAKKFAFLKENGLTPVLCIGETEAQNEAGETVAVLTRQLDAVIKTQGVEALEGSIIAYEPIWAIGTGKAATAQQAQDTHAAIRAHIASYSADVAAKQTIQYGGSVKPGNAAEMFSMEDIDGALVGGAALNGASFAGIVKAAADLSK